ncbi:hypothetical protein [Nocardioides piscis]|uniref:Sulfotransferase family protein n=1 Tax=Nocardioides piscis TaxID=2714938 RepID=A0A6G7YIW0_9ACTN|nr:hypothetical protein [Nocardioides piscis]QIK76684.1 hypothetical protein G7071_15870 [Nocardioides piscis]
MMAFTEHDFVLLAMPKCASTAIESALAPYASLVVDRPPSRKHLGCSGFTRRIAPDLAADGHPRDSYELVTMFRDPVEWLASWWRYRARLPEDVDNSTSDLSFDEFARLYVDGDPTAPTPRGRPAQFLTMDGVVEVDRIFAVDRPDAWLPWFSDRLGADVHVERRNVSRRRPTPDLSAAVRADLVDYFAPELAVHQRLAATGEWAGARGTPLDVPTRRRGTAAVGDAQKS